MMSIKNLLTTALLTVTTMISYAQFPSIKWGEDAKANRASGHLESLGWNKGFLYNLEQEVPASFKMGGNFRLEKVSKNMQLVYSKELDAKVNYFSAYHHFISDDVINLVTADYTLTMKDMSIVKHEFDLNGNKITKSNLLKIPLKGLKVFSSTRSSTAFVSSPDKTKIGFAASYSDPKELKTLIHLLVIDSDEKGNVQEKLVEKTITHKVKYEYFKFTRVEVFDNGNILVNISYKEEDEETVTNKLQLYSSKGDLIKEQELIFEEFRAVGIHVKVNKENKIFMTAFLSSKVGKESRISGFFLATIDNESLEFEKLNALAYTEEFFTSLGYKVKKDGAVKFYGVYDLEIVLADRGDGYLVAHHKTGINREIVVYPFDSQGELGDPLVVPMYLRSYHPLLNGLGYFPFIKNDKLYLVYSDHKKNLLITDLDDLKMADNPKDKNTAIFIAEIEEGKSVKRKILSEKNDIKGYLIPEKCQASSEYNIINIGNGNKTQYGKLMFK